MSRILHPRLLRNLSYNLALDDLDLEPNLPELSLPTRKIRAVIEVQHAKAKLRLIQYNHFKDSTELLQDGWVQNEIAINQYIELLEQCEMGKCDHGLSPSLHDLLEQAFRILFILKNEGVAVVNAERLFYYFEKSKSSFMRERFLEMEAQTFTALPKPILNKMHDLSIKISFYEKNYTSNSF